MILCDWLLVLVVDQSLKLSFCFCHMHGQSFDNLSFDLQNDTLLVCDECSAKGYSWTVQLFPLSSLETGSAQGYDICSLTHVLLGELA